MKSEKIMYKIKTAKNGDVSACINLSRESWPNWWAKNMKMGSRHVKERVNSRNAFVVILKGKIIGYCIWGRLWTKVHIEDIYVEKDYRRMGIATALLEKVEKAAKNRGFREMVSDCDVDNKASLKLHLGSGFKKCGFIKNNWAKKDSYVFSMKIC